MFYKKMRKYLLNDKKMDQERLDLEQDVRVLQGDVIVKSVNKLEYLWSGRYDLENKIDFENKLVFEKAFQIHYGSFEKGICDCTYTVRGRTFTDLSCMKGETVKEFKIYEHMGLKIRVYPDGGKFLYKWSLIPTFDFADREWDHYGKVAVYADEQGINLIACSHGYKIPQINIYLGLKKAGLSFAPILEELQWGDFGIEMEPDGLDFDKIYL